jgi:beta-N-acetylhexosaminidase
MGQLFMMGWEGQEVTSQIRSLIEDHHLGSIILTTKNLRCRLDVSHISPFVMDVIAQAAAVPV